MNLACRSYDLDLYAFGFLDGKERTDVESHIAEKLHAYTMPRDRPSSRVKDLPDLALIATAGPLDAGQARAAIELTFSFRGTHEIPAQLPAPPESWDTPYASIARADGLQWPTLSDVVRAARSFIDPLLSGPLIATWDPDSWSWTSTVSGHRGTDEEDR